jgi:hypothetical protein
MQAKTTEQANTTELRFSAEGILAGSPVDVTHIPPWLRPKPKVVSGALTLKKTLPVVEADALAKKAFPITWKRYQTFNGKEELDEALESAEAKGIAMPNPIQVLKEDPRLMTEIGAFRDSIRRLYNCQIWG